MTPKMAATEALIDGWYGEWEMWRVVLHSWRLMGKEEPGNAADSYEPIAKALRAGRINAKTPARAFVAQHYRGTSESLWGGAQRDQALQHLRRAVGIHNQSSTRGLMISVRERDKRRDWSTVK